MSWKIDAPEGNETSKVHDRISMFVSGHGVDLGCGCWKLKVEKTKENSCLGVDGGYSLQAVNEADMVADVTDLKMFTSESFDYVYSSHTLEDMPYTESVLIEWWRLVKVGGNLILYLPLTRKVAKEMGLENWAGFYPNMGEPGSNVWHKRDFHPQEIRDMMARIGDVEILADEVRGENDEYSFLMCFRKLSSVWGNSSIQCLCEYHRRHCETNESMARSDQDSEQEVPINREKESVVQNWPSVLSQQRAAAP